MSTKPRREKQELVAEKRWACYAAAGAAAMVAAPAAEAGITYVPVNQTLDASGGPGTVFSTLGFPVGAASSAAIYFGHQANTSVGAAFFAATGPNSGMFAGFSANGYPYVFNLAAGQNVSTAGGFLSGTGTMAFVSGFGNSEFLDPGIGYIGFKFDGGGGTQYGWARVDMAGMPVNAFIHIIDYAFADIGEPIDVGQMSNAVPEPGSLGLLALGAAGLAYSRKRRRKKIEEEIH